MQEKSQDLARIHKLCFGNEERIKTSQLAGCFDVCLAIFPVNEINEWLDDRPQRTALCPRCGFDTVLADDGSFELSLDLLRGLNARYMCGGDTKSTESF